MTAYRNFFLAASRASKTADEAHPNPYDVYAQGNAGSMLGPGWYTCCVGDKYKGSTAQFVMPSHTKGQAMPGFLGGSRLAVPVGANKPLAVDWIKAYTSNQSMTALRAIGNIPNTTSLLGNTVAERAAKRSWFAEVFDEPPTGPELRAVGLEAYVCSRCGYYETYVKDPAAVNFDKVVGLHWLNETSGTEGPYR